MTDIFYLGMTRQIGESLFAKLWKSLAALVLVFGLLSPTSFSLTKSALGIIILLVIGVVVYWELTENVNHMLKRIRKIDTLEKRIKRLEKKVGA